MHQFYSNQTILAFWAPKLKIAQLLLAFTPLRTFPSKCRIFTHFAAIYPVITSGTFFKKKIKRLKQKVCIVFIFSQKANSSHLYVLNHSDCLCMCSFHTSNTMLLVAVRICKNIKMQQEEDLYICKSGLRFTSELTTKLKIFSVSWNGLYLQLHVHVF